MNGLCECGCGQRTAIATQTRRKYGHVKGEPVRFVTGHQLAAAVAKRWRESDNRRWGVWFNKALGRWYVRCRDGNSVPFARVVLQNKIGRELVSGEDAHHINGDCSDDRPENLEAHLHGDHLRLHLAGKPGRPVLPPDEIQRRIDLYRSGLTLREVGEICGVRAESIRETLARADEPRRPRNAEKAA